MYKYKKSKFLVLIPAFNELNNLKKFVKKINKFVPVYILDDCSKDNTEEWLIKNKVNYCKNKKNLGYEINLLNGIKKFRNKCEFLITFDGDGQHKISDLKKIIKMKMNYDIIVCNRKNKNRPLEEIISKISYVFFGIKDPLTGFKVYNTNILNNFYFNRTKKLFLVDFLLTFLNQDLNIINYTIKTNRRNGAPRVGNFIGLSLKESKILIRLITRKISIMLFNK